MYRLRSDDRIIALNRHIDPTIYILMVTHKAIGENRGKGGLHGDTIHLIIEVTLEQEVSFVVHPQSDLHKYVYYRCRVLMLHYELESSIVFIIFCPFEFGNTKKPMLGSVIICTPTNRTISMLCHFPSVFCKENFPRCRHLKCLTWTSNSW